MVRVAGLSLLLFAAAVFYAAPAQAGPSEAMRRQAKDMSNRAAKHFAHKRYIEAAELFEQAYALDHDKLIRLRNAGRAFEEAKRYDRALHCFLRYLERSEDPKLRTDAKERVARFRAELAKGSQDKAGPDKTVVPDPPPAPRPDPNQVGNKGSAAGVPSAGAVADPSPGSGPGMAPWLIGGGGLALVAGGVVWVLAANAAADHIDEDEEGGHYNYTGGDQKLSDDRSALSTNRIAAWSVTGLGTAAVAAGAWLLLSGGGDAHAAWPRPGLGPNRWTLAWRF